jgi:hypothetical protein
MFCISRVLGVGFIAFSLSTTGTPLALAAGAAQSDVKIEAKDIEAKEAKDRNERVRRASGVAPLNEKSLAAGHAAAIHPFEEKPETKDTHTLRLESK